MKEYLLLFRGGDTERGQLSPEELQGSMMRWQQWISGIAANGQLSGAQPLEPGGKVIKGPGKKLTDGPFIEGKEVLGGYVQIKAEDYDAAVAIALNCPNLETASGTVEIREIGIMPAM